MVTEHVSISVEDKVNCKSNHIKSSTIIST